MKISLNPWMPLCIQRRCAFTLVEMMISMSIFGLAVAGLLAVQMFALRQNQLVESKCGASDQARRLLEKMSWEIRSSKEFYLGSVSSSNFTKLSDNGTQRATAIQLTTPSTNYITYFFNTNARTLSRMQSGISGVSLVAEDLTNNMFFQMETWYGTVVTTNDHKWRVCIRTILEFAQYQYPLTKVGPGCYYDYYKMEYKITPHSPGL